MTPEVHVLQPAATYLPGLESGEFRIKEVENRVIRSDSGAIVASLVLGSQLQNELARLPLDPSQAAEAISQSGALKHMARLLDLMQLTSTVGSLGSVANIGLSCVDFAVVLPRLSRIDGKLDECFEKIDVLKRAVRSLHTQIYALSMARLRPADEALGRSLMADSEASRVDLAQRARDLFSESKNLYLQLWKHARPWEQPTVDVPTALEMKNRFVTCAIGELQAEFICGDMGRFKHAVRSTVEDYDEHFQLDAPQALRARSDGACSETDTLARFTGHLPQLSGHLRLAAGVVKYTKLRLAAFEGEAQLPALLGLEAHQIARATRQADGCLVYALAATAAAQA